MHCSRVQNLLSAYCDSELTGAEMLQVRQHLGCCPTCKQEHESLLTMKRLMGALSGKEPPRPFAMEDVLRRDAESRTLRGYLYRCAPVARLLDTVSEAVGAARVELERTSTRLTLVGTLATIVVAVAVVQRPQPADAVLALVPESLSTEAFPDSRAQWLTSWGRPMLPLAHPAARETGLPVVFTGERYPLATVESPYATLAPAQPTGYSLAGYQSGSGLRFAAPAAWLR